MRSILILLCVLLFSVSICGQTNNSDNEISAQDKILLQKFWKDFTDAVNKNDKKKLETLCEFPFYCSPCIDYIESKNNNLFTVKVTRALYHQKYYKIFFEQALKTDVKKHQKFNVKLFHPYFNEEIKRHGMSFLYTLVPPSEHWEGSQGMITLRKIEGKFKITGIDTVP